MSGLPLSGATRALLEAAKGDAPAAAARAKIWSGVVVTAGIGAAAGTTSLAVGAGASAGKLVGIGALLGSVITVGVTLAVLRVTGPAPAAVGAAPPLSGPAAGLVAASPTETVAAAGERASELGRSARPASVAVPTPAGGTAGVEVAPALAAVPMAPPSVAAALQAEAPVAAVTAVAPALVPVPAAVQAAAALSPTGPSAVGHGVAAAAQGAPRVRAGVAPNPAGEAQGSTYRPAARHGAADPKVDPTTPTTIDDPLMREAALVAEARSALVRGDPLGALRTIRATASGSQRELEPEELSIEARALRALGRGAEADTVDVALRTRYPDHALSR